ncbi:hypothetical protein BG015_001907 [Linnemannia schmuckeri]|uniref:Uncharacterized protein n=1 Tax=Linnemannia schmuckeri TaxID=64567 RepID=A0A9P5V6H8_9FUNG|nr:hypothetical protein BG015_001907 [Linnemannia schmuckeri]
MYSQPFSRPLAAIVLSLGLLTQSIYADSFKFTSPSANIKIAPGDAVPVTYKIHHNGMAMLLWAKVHLMTEDGYDAGMGTIDTASRLEWQDSKSVSAEFEVPADMKAGKYVLHVYGSTEQPCEGSIDSSSNCEGILSEMLPVEIIEAIAVEKKVEKENKAKKGALESLLGFRLPKHSLYAGRDLGMHIGGSDYLLEDGTTDTKKMLYFFSLI